MQIPTELLPRAISLASIGCNELAWAKADALELLETLQANHHVVLGGDVLQEVDGKWQHNYDNWHFNPDPSHTHELNSVRSVSKARQYIQNYPVGPYLFVLVSA